MKLKDKLTEEQRDRLMETYDRWKLDYLVGDAGYVLTKRDGFVGYFPIDGKLADEFGRELTAVGMNVKGNIVFIFDDKDEHLEIEASPHPWYVTMTDAFFSGWGPARKKNNKLIIECLTADEADIVADNARRRGDQRYIRIVKGRPDMRSCHALVQRHCRIGYDRWFQPHGF